MNLALVLAVFVGALIGTLGSGGSILLTPVLVHIGGVPAHRAVMISLLVVSITSALASALHFRQGHFHRRAALLFGSTGLVGAAVGSTFTHRVREPVLMTIFAGVLIAAGAVMLQRRAEWQRPERCRPLRCASIGLVVGGLTGFLGVGGGFLIMPSLVLLAGIETHKAVGTSLAVIASNSLVGLLGQLRSGAADLSQALVFLAWMIPGMVLGVTLGCRLPASKLRLGFGVLLLALGAAVAAANVGGL